MSYGRATVLAALGVTLLVTAASGTPLWTVPAQGSEQAPLGSGSASVSVVSAPGNATLDSGRQGGDVYYLNVPNSEVQISQLRGNPLLTYSIAIDELGYSRSSVTGLAPVDEGRASLSLSQDTLSAGRLEQDQYDATLRIVLRGDGEEQVLYDQPVTVEVEQ
jgi:hypothetical protein